SRISRRIRARRGATVNFRSLVLGRLFPIQRWRFSSAHHFLDELTKFFAEPMRTRPPPSLDSGVGDNIAHRRFEAAPASRIQMYFELLVIHLFENPKQMIDQRVEAR